MTRVGIGVGLGIVLFGLLSLPAGAQRRSQPLACTVLGPSTLRRDEALKATKMIVAAVRAQRSPRLPSSPPRGAVPTWQSLGNSPAIATWKTDGGPMGELARKIRWGSEEPLPGWRMHWISTADAYAFTLTDVRDTCAYSYSADERELITRGIATEPPFALVPVDTSFN